jgi:hypothetical protein
MIRSLEISEEGQMDLKQLPELAHWLDGADHVDVKTATGPAATSLRAFVAGVFTYQPRWVQALFAVRWLLVRALGMSQDGLPPRSAAEPERVPITPGETFEFLTVRHAVPDRYWIGGVDDKHLSFNVIAAVEPLENPIDQCRFHLATVVRYNHWTGPVYFNLIRPFHHLIVWLAVKSAAKAGHKAVEAR